MVGRTDVRKPEDGELEDAAAEEEVADSDAGLPSVLLELAAVEKGGEDEDGPVVSGMEEDEALVLRGTDVVTDALEDEPSVTVM